MHVAHVSAIKTAENQSSPSYQPDPHLRDCYLHEQRLALNVAATTRVAIFDTFQRAQPFAGSVVGHALRRPSLTGLVGFECGNPRLKSWAIVGRPSRTKASTKAESRKQKSGLNAECGMALRSSGNFRVRQPS